MSDYSVAIPWHATIFVKVTADNEKEALKEAFHNLCPSICTQCSDNVQLDEINIDFEPDFEELD